MSWLDKLFNRKAEISPEQVIVAEPPEQPLVPSLRRSSDAYVDLKKLAVKDDEPVAGMANQQQISGIKRKSPQVLSYAQSRYRAIGEGGYLAPEYDLAEVGVVEDVESWVRQAFYKKIALMNKEGYDFVGKNPKTIQYIETRLAQIARASRISTNQLMRSIGASLIRMSNAFLVKQRDPKASGGKVRKTPEGKTLKPVAAYFTIPAETMRVKLNKQGDITGWRQEMPDGQYKDFNKDDICHFHIRKKDGFVFGTPDLIPVLDDIRALRNLEETIELLCHKHLFPLFQYIVGTPEQPAGMTEDNEDEVEVVRREIQYMPAEGGIVTPERHKIEAIGAEGKALKAEGYLDYFKLRVIAGLGISEMDLGTGDTANRGTARVLSRQLIDTVKDIQDTVEEQFFNEVISELLLESTFTFDTLAAPHLVKLQYKEIDIENRIEQEKHAAEMFEKNGLTYAEFRNALGKEPIEIPIDPEDQDPTKYPDWHNTHWKLFREPEFIIRAIDEAWTPGAKAAAQARSLGTTQKQLGESNKEQQQKEKRQADENKKTSPSVAKPKSTASQKNNIQENNTDDLIEDRIKATTSYRELEKDIVELVRASFVGNVLADPAMTLQNIQASLTMWANSFAEQLAVNASADFITGFNRVSGGQAYSAFSRIGVARTEIRERAEHYMDKLAKDLYRSIAAALDNEEPTQTKTMTSVRATFDAYRFRIRFISATEMKKAKSYGMLLGRHHIGITEFESVPEDDDVCESCLAMTGRTLSANEFDLDNITPYHPGCRCQLLPKS